MWTESWLEGGEEKAVEVEGREGRKGMKLGDKRDYLKQNSLYHLHIVWYAPLSITHKPMQLACRSNSSPLHQTSN